MTTHINSEEALRSNIRLALEASDRLAPAGVELADWYLDLVVEVAKTYTDQRVREARVDELIRAHNAPHNWEWAEYKANRITTLTQQREEK